MMFNRKLIMQGNPTIKDFLVSSNLNTTININMSIKAERI